LLNHCLDGVLFGILVSVHRLKLEELTTVDGEASDHGACKLSFPLGRGESREQWETGVGG